MKRFTALLLLLVLLIPSVAFAQPSYTLAVGSQSDAVVALQYALFLNGFLEEKYVTGYYGELTAKAVVAYQESVGFEADGIAGSATLTALLGSEYRVLFDVSNAPAPVQEQADTTIVTVGSQNIVYSGDASDPKEVDVSVSISGNEVFLSEPLVLGVKNDFVKVAQERLVALGYLSISETTRYFGEMTEVALKKFQQANGLTADGILGNATATKLMSSNAIPYSGGASSTPVTVGNNLSAMQPSGGYASGATSAAAGNAIQVAMQQMGKPYRYGARGTDAFDCSGLVYYSFKQSGITLPTSSSTQSQYENAIRINTIGELQPGDVVFFNTGNASVTINHCGIYLGNGEFVHASSGGGKVQTNYLTSDFYRGAFRWGLRILG